MGCVGGVSVRCRQGVMGVVYLEKVAKVAIFCFLCVHSQLVVKPVSTDSLVGQRRGVSGSLTREFNYPIEKERERGGGGCHCQLIILTEL